MPTSRSHPLASACARARWRTIAGTLGLGLAALLLGITPSARQAFATPAQGSGAGGTQLSISGASFAINGVVTHAGGSDQGLLMNSRMINGIFDDSNPATVGRWRYPDTQVWDPNRNTAGLIAMLPTYHVDGLDAITVSMQGGRPVLDRSIKQTWDVTGFNSDGSLKPAWMSRLDQLITAAAANHMVVIVNLFYMAQDQRITTDARVAAACSNITNWLTTSGPHAPYTNVMIDVANEIDNTGSDPTQRFDHANLTPSGVPTLLDLIRSQSHGQIPVGTSFLSKSVPPNTVIAHSDVVFLHGNGISKSTLAAHVSKVEASNAYKADPKPIVVNEDDSTGLGNMDTAVSHHTSWGFFEAGAGGYTTGFQSMPANWSINDPAKRAFFAQLQSLGS